MQQWGAFSEVCGHGDGGCHWPLAMVLMSAQTLQVGIVGVYLHNGFFFGLNYLDRSKI